jgi:hypothetical protein
MDSHIQMTLHEIQRATAGITDEQLAWHPHGKWSPAEILEHLTLAYSGTVKGMQRVLAGNATVTRKRTLKDRVFTLVVTGLGYMPSGRKAPATTVPVGSNAANPVEAIIRNLTEMDGVLTEAEKKKGPAMRLTHPVIGPLTIAQWRTFHLVHTKHHMKQIVRLRQLAS